MLKPKRPSGTVRQTHKVLFAGEKSATADTQALAQAKTLESSGASREAIWKDTGWWKPAHDGKWRYEIDDSKSAITDSAAGALAKTKEGGVAVGTPRKGTPFFDPAPYKDVFDHKKFYQAYPGAAQLPKDEKQQTGRNLGVIMTRGPTGEGFTKPAQDQVPADAPDREDFGQSQYIEAMAPNAKVARSVTAHEAQHYIQNVEGFSGGTSPQQAGGFDQYQQNPGEMEARAVEWRLNMTQDERRNTPPWATIDAIGAKLKANPGVRPLPESEKPDAGGVGSQQFWRDGLKDAQPAGKAPGKGASLSRDQAQQFSSADTAFSGMQASNRRAAAGEQQGNGWVNGRGFADPYVQAAAQAGKGYSFDPGNMGKRSKA